MVFPEHTANYYSVTKVLNKTKDTQGLDKWIERVGKEEADRIMKFSANRGKFMHSLFESFMENKFIKNLEKPLIQTYSDTLSYYKTQISEAEIKVGHELFMNMYNNSDIFNSISEILYQEHPVWCDTFKIRGIFDLLIKDINNRKILIDFKSARSARKKSWIEDYIIQLAVYTILIFKTLGFWIDCAKIYITSEDGTIQEFVIEIEELKFYFEEFLKRLEIFKHSI